MRAIAESTPVVPRVGAVGPEREYTARASPPDAEEASRVAAASIPFSKFYRENFPFVWRSACHLAGGAAQADDVVQEVFVVALRRIAEFDGHVPPRAWLFGIMRNIINNQRRASTRRNIRDSVDLEVLPDADVDPQLAAERAQSLEVLDAFLAELDDAKREVFVLAELEQMTAPEIHQATGLPHTTIYARLRDAREAFRAMLKRRGVEASHG